VSTNHPRNIFFEIRLFAWLLSVGLSARAGEQPDIVTVADSYRV